MPAREPNPLGRAVLLLAALLTLAGCMTTSYGAFDQPDESVPLVQRRVEFEVTSAFHRNPPDCVVVLPLRGTSDQGYARSVERALARHLSLRIPRVIGPLERRRLERQLSVDLANPIDWQSFARLSGCRSALEAGLLEARDDYVLVWAQRTVALEAALVRLDDRSLLWRARHLGRRSDGGLPLSPVSLAMEGAAATSFAVDEDIAPSLVDDVVRRMTVTLPDVR